MKRSLVLSCVLLAAGAAAGVAHAATPHAKDPCATKPSKWQREQCEDYTRSAPGDEYFGRMKLSYLGINNTFHDEAIRAGAYTTNSGIISRVNFADEALNAWAKRYPGDPQLARSYFLAVQMYQKIYTQSAQQKAWRYMHLLVTRFPTTYFGKIERADLARGFTEHWFAKAQACPAPVPTATPMPKAGEPAIDVIEPPCLQPTPSPAPVASSTP